MIFGVQMEDGEKIHFKKRTGIGKIWCLAVSAEWQIYSELH
jgi:hypothetical protein